MKRELTFEEQHELELLANTLAKLSATLACIEREAVEARAEYNKALQSWHKLYKEVMK